MGPLHLNALYLHLEQVLSTEAAMLFTVAQTGQTKHLLRFNDNWRLPQVLFHVWKGGWGEGVFSCNMQIHH